MSDSPRSDRQASADEIDVTPEMMEAGRAALRHTVIIFPVSELCESEQHSLVRDIYSAMEAAKSF